MLSTAFTEVSSLHPIVAIATTIIFVSMLYYITKYRNVPPGPVGLPYLGLLPFLKDDNSHTQMEELDYKYGKIFSFTVTGKLYISLGTVKLLREAFLNKSECFNRMTDFSLLSYTFEDGVINSNGERWTTLRKFFTQGFKQYGMTALKESLAEPVYEEIRSTVDSLRALEGKPISLTEILLEKSSAIMRRMLFGDNGITQKELLELTEAYGTVSGAMTSTKLLISGKIAQHLIIPLYSDCRSLFLHRDRMVKILKNVIKRHESKFDENNVNDVIDSFIKERIKRRRINDSSAEYFTDAALISSLIQFVGDGILVVAFFLSSFFNHLVEYPDEQEKLYKEIVDVVGTERMPTIGDKSNLPYTNAFIYEVIRHPNYFPIFPSLECTKETTIQGYRIPKGSMILINVWSAHHDTSVYDNPDEFNPSRFIAKPGKQRPELPVMFGVGKHSCAGEAYVMMQVFLFLTSIVQNFQVSLPEELMSNASIFNEPEKIKLVLKPRIHK